MKKAEQENLVDYKKVQELKDIMEDGFHNIIEIYLNDTEERIATIKKALAEEDALTMQTIAHVLKGSSANIGAIGYSNICMLIEVAAKDERFKDSVPLILQLEQNFPAVKQQLSQT